MNKARFPVSRKKLASDEDVRGKRKTAFPWKSCTSPRVLRDKDLSAGTGRLITLPTWDLLTERRELGASLLTQALTDLHRCSWRPTCPTHLTRASY